MHVCACVYVLMSVNTLDGQKGASELRDSELCEPRNMVAGNQIPILSKSTETALQPKGRDFIFQ